MISPKFIIADGFNVFLDFQHFKCTSESDQVPIREHCVITHNRYLLNHCFLEILHLENTEMQEFDGNYVDYNLHFADEN